MIVKTESILLSIRLPYIPPLLCIPILVILADPRIPIVGAVARNQTLSLEFTLNKFERSYLALIAIANNNRFNTLAN